MICVCILLLNFCGKRKSSTHACVCYSWSAREQRLPFLISRPTPSQCVLFVHCCFCQLYRHIQVHEVGVPFTCMYTQVSIIWLIYVRACFVICVCVCLRVHVGIPICIQNYSRVRLRPSWIRGASKRAVTLKRGSEWRAQGLVVFPRPRRHVLPIRT